MEELEQAIMTADAEDIADILPIIQKRYGQLHPHYELMVVSIDQKADRVKQLERIIAVGNP